VVKFLATASIVLLTSWSALAADQHIITSGAPVGCRDKDMAVTAHRLEQAGNEQAELNLVAPSLASHECIGFKTGDAVVVTKVADESGMLKVRPPGVVDDDWISAASVSGAGKSADE
jgi:hypothetical protein